MDLRAAPRRNRVTPFGELIGDPARGLVFGNRGCLHDGHGTIVRRHNGRRWIACRLQFKDRRRSPLMAPGRYTELFFLDDATALAAGHRPCAECRRDDYRRFARAWAQSHPGQDRADAIDAQLHRERLTARRPTAPIGELPDGTFVADGDTARLVLGDALLTWTPGGYTDRRARPRRGSVALLTPPSLVAVLAAGWAPAAVPLLHPTARGA